MKIGGGARFIRLQIILLRSSHYEKVRTANEAIAVKLLQRNNCNEAIETKSLQQSHCKVTSFFFIFNSSMFVSREISNNLVSLCFIDMYREYCPRSLNRPYKVGRYLDHGQYFSVQIEKAVIIVSILFCTQR